MNSETGMSIRSRWPDIETCEAKTPDPTGPCFQNSQNQSTFIPLTNNLVSLNSAGISNVMITLSRTPEWAVATLAQQTDQHCNYWNSNNAQYGGACYAPTGPTTDQNYPHLHRDGTGDDQIWLYWVAAIAKWVNTPTLCNDGKGDYCTNVKYWEIWNEFTRNTSDLNTNPQTHASWFSSQDPNIGCTNAPCPTIDQLIRMTEDARCVITGQGYVDNYPNAGDHTLCATLEQSPYNWPGPFDTTAEIVQPSVSYPGETASLNSLQCYLYCGTQVGQAACEAWNSSSKACLNTNGWPHASSAVDILNFHGYTLSGSQNPEEFFSSQSGAGSISSFQGVLQGLDKNKPLWMGEGSFGNSLDSSEWWQDPYAQGGYVAKYLSLIHI
mgnify:CR=1 FL=1